MKHTKKALCIIISLLILSSFFTVNYYAQEQTETYSGTTGDCAWEYNSDTKTLTISGEGEMADYTGTNLPPWYIFHEDAKTVIIENGVKTLGVYSFYMFTALENVLFNDTLEEIHSSAFRFCSTLEELNINDKVYYIESDAFSDCDNLKSVHLPLHLTTLGNCVFFNLPKLESIYIPYNLSILNHTFDNCPSLATVHISSNTTLTNSGKEKVFTNCNNIKDVYYYGKLTEKRKKELSNEPAFADATIHYIDKIQYEDEGDSASGTTGDCIWNYDSKTRTLTISGNGRMQDYYDSYTNPWISWQFWDDDDTYENNLNVPEDDYTYENNLNVPEDDYTDENSFNFWDDDYTDQYNNCEFSKKIINIIIEDGVTYIGARAFSSFTALENVYFSDTIESIGEYAFGSCSVEYLNLGKNITNIGHGAFWDMKNLKGINLPENITVLGDYLKNCDNLQSIKLPGKIRTITGGSFENCTGLKSISFGNNIETVWRNAFVNCTSLTDIYFIGTEDEWNKIKKYEEGNEYFLNATVHFNEEMPTDTIPIFTTENTSDTNPTDSSESNTSPVTTVEIVTDPAETAPEYTTEYKTDPAEATIPETTVEYTTDPVEIKPETTAELITYPVETTHDSTTEFITKPVETAPETTVELITDPYETNTQTITTDSITEASETIAATLYTEYMEETSTLNSEPTPPFITTEPSTEFTQDTLPVIPTENITPIIPTEPFITNPIETSPTNTIQINTGKKTQKITAKSYSSVLGAKAFKIKAKAKGRISFSTKSKKVIKLSKKGKVTIKAVGIANVKIHAAGNKVYKPAVKMIKIYVKPPKLKLLSKSGGTNKKYTIYFKKIPKVSGYELLYKAKGEKKYKKVFAKKNSNKFVIKNLKYTKHTIKARAYKKVSKTKLYGAFIKASFGPST